MAKITFILGGARSGKSNYALKIAKGSGKRVAFIATCQPLDKEMKRRINLHKKSRPRHWKTFEEPQDPASIVKKIGSQFDLVIIDCLTLMVSNLLLHGFKDAVIESKIKKMLAVLRNIKARSIIISNEVGLGIVPDNVLARGFRDIAGRANQIMAHEANQVFFMVAGLPLKIK